MAVLLCPAIGWDGLHGHHGFRLLADQFAAIGYPTLRFQYPSTGDSAEITTKDGPAEHWAAWQASVDGAADWLRATTGASRLIVVGLRIGATLATLAAARRDDVEAVMLLAPVLRGKSYIRQLDMEARLESGAAPGVQDGLELNELRLSAETVRQISAIDLRSSSLRAGLKVAIFPQAPSQLVDTCAQAWTQHGVEVHCLGFKGLEPLLQEAIHLDLPEPDFTGVFDWARLHGPAASAAPYLAGLAPLQSMLRLPGCTEDALRFGTDDRLFGILCRPHLSAGKTAVIIGNSGRDPHYGIGRFAVELARRLADAGIASLRMDFAGLGDSPALEGNALSPLFEADRSADFKAAIDTLERLGYTDIALQGLCSGAYHAFRAALADKRVRSLLLVNLPLFEWTGGDTVKTAIWKSAPASRLLVKLSDKQAWKRVLNGQVSVRAILLAQGHRFVDRTRGKMAGLFHRFGAPKPPAGPQQDAAVLAARQVRAQFLYSAGDPGVDALETAFGHGHGGVRVMAGEDIHVVDGINHVLSTRDMRERVATLMVGFLVAPRQSRATNVRTIAHDHSLDHHRSDHAGCAPAEPDARAA